MAGSFAENSTRLPQWLQVPVKVTRTKGGSRKLSLRILSELSVRWPRLSNGFPCSCCLKCRSGSLRDSGLILARNAGPPFSIGGGAGRGGLQAVTRLQPPLGGETTLKKSSPLEASWCWPSPRAISSLCFLSTGSSTPQCGFAADFPSRVGPWLGTCWASCCATLRRSHRGLAATFL